MKTPALLFCLSLPLLLPAQQPHPAFRHYDTADGLPSSEIYHLAEGNDGYLWISTDNGLSRFDGYEFRNFGPKDGLTDNLIFHLMLDSKGRVWAQGLTGNLYYVEGDTIKPYWNNHMVQGFEKQFSKVNDFIVEGDGDTVHLGTQGAGLITIAKGGAWKTYPYEEPAYLQVLEKNGKTIWGSFTSPNRAAANAFSDEMRRQNRVQPIYFHLRGKSWSFKDLHFTRQVGLNIDLFRLGEGQYLYKHYYDAWLFEAGKVSWQHYFPHVVIFAKVMKNGQFFVGLHHHEGLRVYDSVDAFRREEFVTWLPGESVSWFIEDREGGRWFATNDNGIFYAPADAFLVHDLETGLPDEKITSLAIKNERELYAGLGNGEVWRLDIASNKWTKLPPLPNEAFVRDLYFDQASQQLWAGRRDLYFLENKHWRLKGMPNSGGIFSPSNRITQSFDGRRIWACNETGFMSVELQGEIPANKYSAPNARTFIVREDHAGRVWVGQTKGLFEWKNDSLHDRRSLHPAFSLRVEDIALAPDSSLVVATKGGGVVFWKGDRFEQITTAQGLTADMMECVFTDENNVTWAGTLNGLNRINGTWGQRRVEQITTFHGLPSNEINRVAVMGETVWVATGKGLVRFSEKKPNPVSPKPFLKSVLVGNRPLDLSSSASLSFWENNLNIDFFTINYRMNGRIPYRYRLDGGEWQLTQNRSVNFSALSPGERLFEVQSQNEDGAWSETTVYRFTIRPPWWATWWFRSLAAMAAAAAVFGFYKYRTRQLKREHEMQRQVAELERSALQAQMNPHFIFNCLNSIQNFIQKNEQQQATEYLGTFARLVRQTLNASVEGKVSLEDEVRMLENYLALEKLRFKGKFDYAVEVVEGTDAFDIELPPLLVQPFVENAIIHGMQGIDHQGHIHVFFKEKGDVLLVTVEDNGRGIAARKNLPNATAHKSVGMGITQKRLALLGGGTGNGSHVKVEEISSPEGKALGTRVEVRIDLKPPSDTTKKPNPRVL